MRFLLTGLLVLTTTATTATTAPATAPVQFGWPLPGTPTVTRRFDPPPEPWLPGHRGVDLAGSPGQLVLAAGDGRIAFAGVVAGRGVISVDHANGVRTTYEPVTATTTAGASIRRGEPIGLLRPGHPGCTAGEASAEPPEVQSAGEASAEPPEVQSAGEASAEPPEVQSVCLHWGARRGEAYLDPLTLLGLGRIRLKPLAAGAARPPAAPHPRPSRRRARRRATARRPATG